MSNASDFIIENGVLTKYKGFSGDVVIPDGVTAIGKRAFLGCGRLRTITIPDSVVSIGDSAFSGCKNLPNITIPNSVTVIGDGAFSGCERLQCLRIPESTSEIAANLFYRCINLKSIILPNSITRIGDGAFYRCESLESITIPNETTHIGYQAFYECKSLQSVTIPNSVTSVGKMAFYFCECLKTVTVLGENTTFGEQAFRGCEGLADGDGFVIVGKYLFDYYGGEKDIVISETVAHIDGQALTRCVDLASITIPQGVESIGTEAFSKCVWLHTIQLFTQEFSNGTALFKNCVNPKVIYAPHFPVTVLKAAALLFPAAIGYIHNSEAYTDQQIIADYQSYLFSQKKKLLPLILEEDLVCCIEMFAKAGKLTSKNIDEEFIAPAMAANATQCVAFLMDWKNRHISTEDINKKIAQDLKKDPYNVADMKKLWRYQKQEDGTIVITGYKGNETALIIPERIGKVSVTAIGVQAFYGCESLRSVTVPDRIKIIGSEAFRRCKGLADENGFIVVRDVLYGYCGSDEHITVPECVTTIDYEAFFCCRNLKSIVLPDSITDIGCGAFQHCENLQSIKLSDGVKIIGAHTFRGCEKLQSVLVPDGVTFIDNLAFYACGNLQSIVVPSSVTSISQLAFCDCNNLVIHAPAGSYAETYAKENNIPFVTE